MTRSSPETEDAIAAAYERFPDEGEAETKRAMGTARYGFIEGYRAAGLAQTPAEPVMCIGWPTIKRLAAGETVWFESLGCGAVAADDLRGVDVDALLSHSSTVSPAQTPKAWAVLHNSGGDIWKLLEDKRSADYWAKQGFPVQPLYTFGARDR
jgi:hypothetical protein